MWDPYSEFQETVMPNGLKVYSTQWDRPWVKMGFLVHSGAREDAKGKEGTAHFVEHLVSRNVKVADYDSIKRFFEDIGGYAILGVTSYLATLYQFCIPLDDSALRRSLEIFGSMLLTTHIQDHVESQRSVIINEIQEAHLFLIFRELELRQRRSLFPGHRLSRFSSPGGTLENVSDITQRDLQDFYDNHYAPKNISVVCVGGLSHDELIGHLMDSPFNIKKEGTRNTIWSPIVTLPSPLETQHIIHSREFSKEGLEQGEYTTYAALPGNISLQVVEVLLMSLEYLLFQEIREKRGWAYDFRGNFYSFQDVYEFSIGGQISGGYFEHIPAIVEECIETLMSRSDIFERKRQSCVMRAKMLDVSGAVLVQEVLDDLEVQHRVQSFSEVIQNYENISMDDIQQVLAYLQPERRWTLLQYP